MSEQSASLRPIVARRRWDFRALSAAGSPSEVLAQLPVPPPPHVASHAIYCFVKAASARPLSAEDVDCANKLLLRALARPATTPLSGRDVSKAASALGKLWGLCHSMEDQVTADSSAFAAALAD